MDDSKRPKPKCVVACSQWISFLCIVFFLNFLSEDTVLKEEEEEEEEGVTFIDHFSGWILHILTKDGFYLCRVFMAHTVTAAASRASTVMLERRQTAESHSGVHFLSVRFRCSHIGTLWMSPAEGDLLNSPSFSQLTFHLCSLIVSWTVIVGLQ